MLWLVLCAIVFYVAGGFAAALAARSDRAALITGTACAVFGSILGSGASLAVLLGEAAGSVTARWPAPVGQFQVGLDGLSAFFALCVFLVSGLSAVYGAGYLAGQHHARRLAPAVVFFDLLVASMALVVIARDGVLFLLAWEVMSMTSFFLVTFENDRDDVRRAGTIYLAASHAGVVLLILFFTLVAQHAGGFGFDAMQRATAPASSGALFWLALLGFGSKAGFWPMHFWLPEAHPAAPSHVSALMSGVMIKMGVYGLLRALTFLGPPPAWWGLVLLGIGVTSGVGGVLHALAQHDLKRLLAYHSVENIGIIALGIGLGLLGQAQANADVAFVGYAGALLHVLNHGLFKGLLFQGAGSVLRATATRDIDSLGGLARRMPVTALTFLIGAVAISALPPLNGFVSEWLVYVAAFRAGNSLSPAWAFAGLFVAPALALIGGLAAACFVKAYGIVFLGEPRSPAAAAARESGWLLLAPMFVGAALCVAIGLGASASLTLVSEPAAALADLAGAPANLEGPLVAVSIVGAVFVCVALLLALLRARLLRGREVRTAGTWGCGYVHPEPRMQYTAASFAQPLLAPFAIVFRHVAHTRAPEGFFPRTASAEEHLGDRAAIAIEYASGAFVGFLGRLRAMEHGRTSLYLAYVLATLLVLLVWHALRFIPVVRV